jgi:hypothetical protein
MSFEKQNRENDNNWIVDNNFMDHAQNYVDVAQKKIAGSEYQQR